MSSSPINDFEVATTTAAMMSAGQTTTSASGYPAVTVCAPTLGEPQFALADPIHYHHADESHFYHSTHGADTSTAPPRRRKADKRPYTRSRDGCFTCRLRRKKCSEEQPFCQTCINLNIPCEYERPLWWYNQKEKRDYKRSLKDVIQQNKFQMKRVRQSSKSNTPKAAASGRVMKPNLKPQDSISRPPPTSAPIRPPPYTAAPDMLYSPAAHDQLSQEPHYEPDEYYHARSKSHDGKLAYYQFEPMWHVREGQESEYPPPDGSYVCPSTLHVPTSYQTEHRPLSALAATRPLSPSFSPGSFDIVDKNIAPFAGPVTTQGMQYNLPPSYDKPMLPWNDGAATTGHSGGWSQGLTNEPLPAYSESSMKSLDEQHRKDEVHPPPVDPALELLDLSEDDH